MILSLDLVSSASGSVTFDPWCKYKCCTYMVVYINERKSICKMHIGYIILYVLMFNVRKVRISFLGPCTHLDRTVLMMLQHKMPNFSWTSRFLKWSARTGHSTIELSTNEIKTSCFHYLFSF